MLAYQHILRIATFCYMLHIGIMWLELYPPKSKPYPWLMSALNFSPLRLLLCMRLADVSMICLITLELFSYKLCFLLQSNDYIQIQQYPWKEIAKTLNALSFLIVNLIFIIAVMILLPHA